MSNPYFADSSSSVDAMPNAGTRRGSRPIGRIRSASRVLLSITKTRRPEKRSARRFSTSFAQRFSSRPGSSPSNHIIPSGTFSSWYFWRPSNSYVERRGRLRMREKCASLSRVRSPVNSTWRLSFGLKSRTSGRAAPTSASAPMSDPAAWSEMPRSRGPSPPKAAPKRAWPRSCRAAARKRGYHASSALPPRKKPTMAVSKADVTRSKVSLSSTSLTTGRRCL
mmetsp:Transcript_86286/g.244577  ORF Transcript_86286/g.244577 Transcript_86286/m.244577 type:complete len:223 (+) Transcript_86286:872-1540(+)